MIKKYLLASLAGLFIAGSAFAQQQRSGIGLHFGAHDFYGPQTDKYFGEDVPEYDVDIIYNHTDTSDRHRLLWDPLVRFTYWREITQNFDIQVGLSLSNVYYPGSRLDSAYVSTRITSPTSEKRLLAELDFTFHYNILNKQSYICSPYLLGGISATFREPYFGAVIPLGAGLNINLSRDKALTLNLESAYKVSASDHDVNHLQHSAGFVYWFKPGYHTPKTAAATTDAAPLAPVVLDGDNDGIEDSEDQCPTIAGTAQFNGCPDTDSDGISDKDDVCPLVAGLAQFNGCPDTDGDGIPDNKDKCPYVAGTADREGCPVPDKDNDGFADDADHCPDVFSRTNEGCPEIRKEIITQVEKAAKAIFFETGKATIKKISFKSLDAVVAILKGDATLYADIEGHTDNVQPKTYTNMELSQKRAEAVRDYFVSKGVNADRLTAQGFGDTQPVADNASAAGKAQNRRTVIKLRNFTK